MLVNRFKPGEDWLGPLAHVGMVVGDFEETLALLSSAGIQWSTEIQPYVFLVNEDGIVERPNIRYVTSSGHEPRLKIISAAATGFFSQSTGSPFHHLSYWVDDLDLATAKLIAAGFATEITGYGFDGSANYRYFLGPGSIRIELGLERNRGAFDAWANVLLGG
jgi:hypothetical protein